MESVELDAKASQTAFGKLVGMSQQAVSKQIEKGNLSEGGTYRDWLLDYCEQLRDQAAGRGGEGQIDVAQANYDLKVSQTAMIRLDYHEKLGNTVHKEETFRVLSDWSTNTTRYMQEGFERLRRDLNDQFDIEVPPELVEKHAGSAIERVRGYVLKLVGSSAESSSGDDSASEAEQ